MQIARVIPQLRTSDLAASIAYVDREEHLHLYIQTPDVAGVAAELERKGVTLVRGVHTTDWGTRECVVKDNQGYTLYFGEPR